MSLQDTINLRLKFPNFQKKSHDWKQNFSLIKFILNGLFLGWSRDHHHETHKIIPLWENRVSDNPSYEMRWKKLGNVGSKWSDWSQFWFYICPRSVPGLGSVSHSLLNVISIWFYVYFSLFHHKKFLEGAIFE